MELEGADGRRRALLRFPAGRGHPHSGSQGLTPTRPTYSQQLVLPVPDGLVAQEMLALCWDLEIERTQVKGQ